VPDKSGASFFITRTITNFSANGAAKKGSDRAGQKKKRPIPSGRFLWRRKRLSMNLLFLIKNNYNKTRCLTREGEKKCAYYSLGML
jgi:hypothetical protein